MHAAAHASTCAALHRGGPSCDVTAEDLEDLYTEAHEKIRENPVLDKKERSKPSGAKRWKTPKLSLEQKKANLKAKLLALKEAEE